jgi:Mn2+/Fe2+ NRAMP family transporter
MGDAIRQYFGDGEKFGLKLTALIMFVFVFANIGTIAAEFAGVAAALEILNIARLTSYYIHRFNYSVSFTIILLIILKDSKVCLKE